MDNKWKGVIGGAVGGAGTGFMIGGPIGAAIGGAVGGIGGFFAGQASDKSEAEAIQQIQQENAKYAADVAAATNNANAIAQNITNTEGERTAQAVAATARTQARKGLTNSGFTAAAEATTAEGVVLTDQQKANLALARASGATIDYQSQLIQQSQEQQPPSAYEEFMAYTGMAANIGKSANEMYSTATGGRKNLAQGIGSGLSSAYNWASNGINSLVTPNSVDMGGF